MLNKDRSVDEAIKKLSQYDEWETVCKWLLEQRDGKFGLVDKSVFKRTDAKLMGAMSEDNYIYEVFSQFIRN